MPSVAQRTLGKRAMEEHIARCLPSAVICRVFFPYLPSARVCRVFFSRIAECQNVCRVFFSKALDKQRVCRVSESLPSVFSLALGKEMVCRVSIKIYSAKNMTLGKAFDFGSDGDRPSIEWLLVFYQYSAKESQSLLDSGSLPRCLRHSAKTKLHSAKPLPSAALGKEHTAKIWSAKPSLSSVFYRTLGKEKRPSRRRSRWRSLCRVSTLQALGKDFFNFFLKKFFAERQPMRHSAKSFYFFFENFLCRVPTRQALGKDFFFNSLPSANPEGTRQRDFFFLNFLCRVPTRQALGKDFLFFF